MQHLLSTILLGPILLAQGKYVRATIEMLDEPPGLRQGVVGQGPEIGLLIVGDSAAAGVGCSHQDEALLGQILTRLTPHYTVNYCLQATTGHNSADCLHNLQTLEPKQYDVVLTSLGVNDVTSGCSLKSFEQRQRNLVSLAQNKFGAKQVILSGLPPVGNFPALPNPLRWYLGAQAKRFDRVVEKITLEPSLSSSLDYIKFEFDGDTSVIATDGFHPGPKVYSLWAELAAQIVLDNNVVSE